ncbi:MAG: cytochrome c maturation protein CcmE [Bacteroidetes bacterium]|nr:cytochrome c maturation protein CcmE [Bacteroidota bacterium]
MKKTHIIALIFIAASIGIIITMVDDSLSYATFKEAHNFAGQEFHIVGTLDKEQPQFYDPVKDPNYFTFYMKDADGTAEKVIFLDAKPSDIDRSTQIVVVGRMGEEGFMADQILRKCPSKYIEDELQVAEENSQP